MMHEGKQNMRSMCSATLLVSKSGVPRFQRCPNSKHHHPRCNAGEKQNVGGKPCNAMMRHAKGKQNTDGKPYNARMWQAKRNRPVKPNLYAREDRSRKQCMQCKL